MYHAWMKSEELRAYTASEPLTLDEEYEMQQSWRSDDDKCTFLILDKDKYDRTGNEIESLVGDTNLFLLDNDDDDDKDNDNEQRTIVGEAEIMIAEPTAQRKHFGWEAMLLMLTYGHRAIGCRRFVAKIGFANERSIHMFTKMQFAEASRSEVFEEITYYRPCTAEWLEWLAANVEYTINEYHKG